MHYNEDSSDYISDAEGSKVRNIFLFYVFQRLKNLYYERHPFHRDISFPIFIFVKSYRRDDNDSPTNSNSHLGPLNELHDDYSNDSDRDFDRDRESFSCFGSSSSGKLPKGGSQLNVCLEYIHRMVHRKDKEGEKNQI